MAPPTTTFVLVHGATGGGWQWRAVADLLRATGALVFTPTLTGLGERSHLLNPTIDLDTHILDVINVLRFEELNDVVLVGKSYSGMVVTGAAEELPERLRRLVYLDAVVPQDGQAMLDVLGEPTAAMLRGLVERAGDGWRLPLPPGAPARITEHPFACLTQPLRLSNPSAAQVPRTYIRCTHDPTGQHGSMTSRMATRARSDGWDVRELESDHDAEQHLPEAVATVLAQLAA